MWYFLDTLQWRHNDHDGVSNHQPHGCLLNGLFGQIKENIKAQRHWPLCGEFTGTGEFPAQRASNAESVSIWWRHHVRFVTRPLSPSQVTAAHTKVGYSHKCHLRVPYLQMSFSNLTRMVRYKHLAVPSMEPNHIAVGRFQMQIQYWFILKYLLVFLIDTCIYGTCFTFDLFSSSD